MNILHDVGRGIHVALESRGQLTRIVIESTAWTGEERILVARRAAAYMQMIWEIMAHAGKVINKKGH